MNELDKKLAALYNELANLGSIVIAFSGGVDSTFLAAAAKNVLGDNIVAITACSDSFTGREIASAKALAKQLSIKHILLPATEFDNPLFINNTSDRCYYCKKERFLGLLEWARINGYSWVAEGSNVDDLKDYRPGMKAIKELGVIKSPLLDAGFTKSDIRELSREWGLPTWNQPSAACLVSRLSYGQTITPDKLNQIEQCEDFLHPYCTGQVRVRHHGDLARIEVDIADITVLASSKHANEITRYFRKLGFKYVTLDLAGYRTGSMNDSLKED
ncbi:MAG: ATP-dependent sacrificial sulfur transferase LarE [Veillonellaceae bacterium]|jgi:uncharacterized protein|nr:ATP-dependent sacrificial sulfur transferase LarE [Veillonellaceae bacterium]